MKNGDRLLTRLMARTTFEPNSGCWLWMGFVHPRGYGHMKVGTRNHRVHRLSYHLHTGIDPGSLHVMHSCDVRICINPAHLSLGSNRENIDDKVRKGRHQFGERTPIAVLTEADVLAIRRATGTLREIGQEFGICRDHVFRIRKRLAWRHLD